MQKLRSIQILRAVAAAMVLWFHAQPSARVGGAGVDLFFVISGFIITHTAREKTAPQFLRDRLIRILPLYLLIAAPSVLIAVAYHLATPARMAATLTFWPAWGAEYARPYVMNAWSLQFEMLFYAAATVAVGVVGSWRWLIGAYALAMAGAFLHGGPALRFTGNPLILEFLAGVAIARAPRFPIPAAVTALVLGAALLALTARFDLAEMANPLSVFELTRPERTMLWGVPVALIVAGAVGLERLFAWRGLDAAVFLGDASYSTYLVPPLVTNFFTGPWPIIEIALGLLIGAGAFRYVERPVVQWIRRRLLPPAAAMAAAAA